MRIRINKLVRGLLRPAHDNPRLVREAELAEAQAWQVAYLNSGGSVIRL